MTWLSESVKWYLVLVAASWGLGPLVMLVCRRLPDRGVTLVRPLALLGVVYPTWLLASLKVLPYSTAGLWATLGLLTAAGWAWAIRTRQISTEWLRLMLIAEGISLAAFAAYIWLRGYTPAMLNTEKPMDSAFLSATARTTVMPPQDPWMSGESLNYYYLGYLLHGSISRMAAVPTNFGFNLALATTFSMTITAAAGVGYNLARVWLSRKRAVWAAVLTAVFLTIMGNMYAATKFVEEPSATINATWWPSGTVNIGWLSSRVVCDGTWTGFTCSNETINEFPYFSFLLGDLHPHLMALPFTLVALGLAFNLLLLRGRKDTQQLNRSDWIVIGISGAVVGALYMMNSWDFPTYLLIGLIALWLGVPWRQQWTRLTPLAAMIGFSIIPWLPFIVTFKPFAGGSKSNLPTALQNVPGLTKLLTTIGATSAHTSIGEFLTIFAVPFVACLALVIPMTFNRWSAGALSGLGTPVVVSLLALVALGIFSSAPLVIVCGIPALLIVILLTRQREIDLSTVVLFLFGVGLVLIVLTEFFYIQDVFQSRMNTLFKVYYQAWTLFAIATAATVVCLWESQRVRTIVRPAVAVGLAIALLAGAVYPTLASYQWTDHFANWQGLNGLSYLNDGNSDEVAAIDWLKTHASKSDVLLESAGCSYLPNSLMPFDRASAYTGIPTVIGWGGHEGQWRGGQPALEADIQIRQQDVATMFNDPQSPLIAKYGVTLLYVGHYERANPVPSDCQVAGPYAGVGRTGYPGPGWTKVFAQGQVAIYRRN